MNPLTRNEEMILLAVCQLGDKAYGISIRRHIESMLGKKFSVGAIYVPLERLMRRGLLSSYTGEPTPERGGRSKRYYRITTEGLRSLRETKELHDDMWAGFPGFEGIKAAIP